MTRRSRGGGYDSSPYGDEEYLEGEEDEESYEDDEEEDDEYEEYEEHRAPRIAIRHGPPWRSLLILAALAGTTGIIASHLLGGALPVKVEAIQEWIGSRELTLPNPFQRDEDSEGQAGEETASSWEESWRLALLGVDDTYVVSGTSSPATTTTLQGPRVGQLHGKVGRAPWIALYRLNKSNIRVEKTTAGITFVVPKAALSKLYVLFPKDVKVLLNGVDSGWGLKFNDIELGVASQDAFNRNLNLALPALEAKVRGTLLRKLCSADSSELNTATAEVAKRLRSALEGHTPKIPEFSIRFEALDPSPECSVQ